MALLEITRFFFDTETNNVKLQLAIPVEVEYSFDSATNGFPVDYLTGELFLDGQVAKVGSYRPKSDDGTTVPENTTEGQQF